MTTAAGAAADLKISAEVTPNPNTIKLNVNRRLLDGGSLDYPSQDTAGESLLASRLFETPAVSQVFIGKSFVSITKREDADWEELTPVLDTLKQVLNSGQPVVSPEAAQRAAAGSSSETDSEIERQIRELLDAHVRPAVARDGGDITLFGYEDGVVTLRLQGACGSCPSSTFTLKMGVENLLKTHIPEVREVVAV